MPRVNRAVELTTADRIDIVLRYERIKYNDADETIHDLCQEYRINRSYPSTLLNKFKNTGSVASKSRSGRPSKVKNVTLQNEMEESIRIDRRRNSTCRRLARQLNCSHDVANRMRKHIKMKICMKISRPPLSAQNIQRRAEFVNNNPRWSRTTAYLDEKWWYCFRQKKHIYRRSTSPVEFEHRPTHVPKMMFVAVISPAAEEGKVGLWPVAVQRTYQRNSRYHRRGDPYWLDVSHDGPFFCRLLDEKILPACERLGINILQFDNATPHVVENDNASLTAVMARHPTIQVLRQPAQSPDVNPLDQGLFRLIADRVELRDPTNRDQLHETVIDVWNHLRRRDVMRFVIEQNEIRQKIAMQLGGNRFV